ncbi:hypothetical protein [Streptomyces sp. NPDC059144]
MSDFWAVVPGVIREGLRRRLLSPSSVPSFPFGAPAGRIGGNELCGV